MYTLSLDTQFAPFLVDGATWLKKTKANPLRGFTDDGSSANPRLTAQQKVNMLELMLGQIANYCPVISRNTIVKNSTSVDCMWASIRLHYGFQVTEAHFVDFTDIHSEHGERPENLFQRLIAFMEDNLLRSDNLTHHGERATEDEEMSPSLENFVILTWLRLINPELPRLVKQRYGTELRSCTLASIKPEISQALPSLLDELQTAYDAKAMRTAASTLRPPPPPSSGPQSTSRLRPYPNRKVCPLCKQAGRPDSNYLGTCAFLPDTDRKFIAKARQIAGIFDCEESSTEYGDPPLINPLPSEPPTPPQTISGLRIQVRQSPYLDTFYHHHPVRVTTDCGTTGNMSLPSRRLVLRSERAHSLPIKLMVHSH